MPGCSARYCNNRTESGFKMIAFPKNAVRRRLWEKQLNIPNWKATDNCCLCEVHFDEEQWRIGKTGKRKLARTAIPKLFFDFTKNEYTIVTKNDDESDNLLQKMSLEYKHKGNTKKKCISIKNIDMTNIQAACKKRKSRASDKGSSHSIFIGGSEDDDGEMQAMIENGLKMFSSAKHPDKMYHKLLRENFLLKRRIKTLLVQQRSDKLKQLKQFKIFKKLISASQSKVCER